jgi:exopolyphosphatase/guanosine-5'-triphosphate,3'-diphosphate pyrophosphatase
VLCACIDIGSNTTRLLVAEPAGDQLREVCQQRAFTRIGKGMRRSGEIPAEKIDEVAQVVATQVRMARELGAETIRAVATAAIRTAANGEELCAAVTKAADEPVHVLDGREEAHLAFVGATRALGRDPKGDIAVIDVGGGSAEIALGTVSAGVHWSNSFRVGSGMLADHYLRSDPPSISELHAVREHAFGVFEGLDIEAPALGIAVGGSATSLRRLVGAELEHDTLERGVRVLASAPAAEVAQRFDLDPERVRLLPAGILILEAISDTLRVPLQIGRGGLREGVILELIAGRDVTREAA